MKIRWLLPAAFIMVLAGSANTMAQSYPARPIRYVLPFAAGSAVDALARLYAQRMSENWKQQVVVDNRTSANGIIGTELAARSPADGYTVYLGNVATLAINPHLYPKLPYDVARDFAPISLTAEINNTLVVHPSLPVKSVKELIALAKARPGELNYASGGVGSAQHIPMEMLKAIISRLNAEVVRITRLPDTRERLSAAGFALVGSSPQEFADYIKANTARIGKVVRDAGIQAE